MGSKTKLLHFIDDILEREKIVPESFADIFAGTGTVANHFYTRSNIILNDILDSNRFIYQAFFGEGNIRKSKIINLLVFYNSLDVEDYKSNYFSQNFSNTYFDATNSKKIGIIREDIEKQYEEKHITSREKAYLITSLLYALDKIANTVGHYDAYRKINIPEKKLTLLPLEIRESPYKAKIYQQDANELVKNVTADVVYIDPPYNSRQYSDAYHLLENIATWKKEEVAGVAKKINRDHIKSKYSMKSAGLAFGELIDAITAKYILVSYNDMGDSGDPRSKSRISDHELLSILERKGEVKIFETNFKQFTAGKSHKDDLKERIFLCKVRSHAGLRVRLSASKSNPVKSGFIKSPLNYTGGKHKLLPQITKYFPENVHTFYDIFSGGANVGINAEARKIICIEKNMYVVKLLRLIQESNFEELNRRIHEIIEHFNLSQSYSKGYSFYQAESSGGLGQVNKNSFLELRNEFNKAKTKIELLLVLILYSFNNQIRFNANGDFNLPVGKRDYNGSSRKNIAAFNQLANEKTIYFKQADFRDIKSLNITKDDFVYLDPPYLLGLASYNELGGWTTSDERDLYKILSGLNKNGIKFALSNVLEHKGQVNAILEQWVEDEGLVMRKMDFHYKNSNYHSSAKRSRTIEVLVTNY